MKKTHHHHQDIPPNLRITHGKRGISELRSVHLRYTALVVLFVETDGDRIYTKAAIACRVSDADLRKN